MDDAEAREMIPQSGDFTSASPVSPPRQESRDTLVRLETRGIDYVLRLNGTRAGQPGLDLFRGGVGCARRVGGLLPVFGLGSWPSFWA